MGEERRKRNTMSCSCGRKFDVMLDIVALEVAGNTRALIFRCPICRKDWLVRDVTGAQCWKPYEESPDKAYLEAIQFKLTPDTQA